MVTTSRNPVTVDMSHTAKETVGIIGLGAMGTPMANNLIAAGFATWVFDIDKARVHAVVKSGAKAAESPRHLSANVRAPSSPSQCGCRRLWSQPL